jgi:hypothetical protein
MRAWVCLQNRAQRAHVRACISSAILSGSWCVRDTIQRPSQIPKQQARTHANNVQPSARICTPCTIHTLLLQTNTASHQLHAFPHQLFPGSVSRYSAVLFHNAPIVCWMTQLAHRTLAGSVPCGRRIFEMKRFIFGDHHSSRCKSWHAHSQNKNA